MECRNTWGGDLCICCVCISRHGRLVLFYMLISTLCGVHAVFKKGRDTCFCAKFSGSLVILITPNGRRNYYSHLVALQQERITQM